MQYECSNIECGAVFQYDWQSCGHHVPPNRCPVCGSTNPVESGSEAAKAVEAKHDAILAGDAPTPEEWNAISDTIGAYTGLPTTLEGGGAACPFIRIELPDGRVGLLGDVNETWTVDLYADKDHEERADGPAESLDLLIPTDYKGDEREYNLHPEHIADELRKALRNVCIAGEPALAGRCGDPECVCHPSKDSAEDRTRTGNTPTELLDPESEEAEALLDAVKEAQTAYWNALHELEEALGVEIESTQDLQGMTCTDLTSDEDEMEQERRTR